ncbi:MAG: hydantoinase B/oxoprolinase family protein [Gammaproteobacteria bacterium]|nr:hydantoinase B/oxoprolinase family protein [Gammaproteobacteria bacterium]
MWSRLLAVVEEQGQALIRSAFSLIVRECGDISAGLFDVKGSMMAQAVTGTPGHINTMAEGVRNFIAAFPIDTMDPGDIYVTNDPWLAAGHLNDFMLVQPIFKHGHVIGFSSCTSHLVDVGGLCMGPQGSDIYDEGILIPPCCIVQSGQINELLFDIIKSNSRAPIENEGDLYALIACCEVGVDRLLEMLGDYQADDLQVLSHYIFEVSRKASREAIKRIPNGIYENTLLLDGYESEIVLKGKVTVNDEQIELDLEGSSPCSKYGINVPLNYAAAYSVFAIRCVVAAGVPNNGGSLEPFKVTAPENCIVNALHPTPVAMRHTVGQLLPDLVFGCLHQALPGQVSAEGASCMYDIPMRNAPNAADNQFAIELVHNGGTGARPQSDGLSATAYPSGVWGSQVEVTEATVPIHIARRELRIDSGGPGQFRGGLGQTIEFRSSIDAPFLLFLSLDRMHHPARGLQGGLPGAAGQVRVYSVGSQGRLLPGRGEVLVEPNESVIFESPGGGGFGSPQDRPKNAIETDVFQGLVSPEKAQTDYYLTCYLTKADKT